MIHREEAESLFAGGFNCAQSLLTAYGVNLGIDRDIALKLASAFGAGMARSGQMCGAVTGALMVIGLKFGAANSWNKVQKAKVQSKAAQFIKKFNKIHGDTDCRRLIGLDLGTEVGRKEARKKKIFETVCVNFVRDAAAILDKMV
jgi:C_GCAxxG_C_C family probable redox protein